MGNNRKKKDAFPFPAKDVAMKELTYDPCYKKIPEKDRAPIAAKAWETGAEAAKEAFRTFDGSFEFFSICQKSGLTLKEKNIDFVAGGQRYFSDYVSGKGIINLYLKSISLWAEQNGMEMRDAENLILSHEYFHYLEWTKLGLTSRQYQVPMIEAGPLHIGKTGIRALSEIGAHGFSRTYHDLYLAAQGQEKKREKAR